MMESRCVLGVRADAPPPSAVAEHRPGPRRTGAANIAHFPNPTQSLTVTNERCRLDPAEALVREHGLAHSDCGILVTRHSDTACTVDLSREVPHGLPQARCAF